jgi:hypothetical protein
VRLWLGNVQEALLHETVNENDLLQIVQAAGDRLHVKFWRGRNVGNRWLEMVGIPDGFASKVKADRASILCDAVDHALIQLDDRVQVETGSVAPLDKVERLKVGPGRDELVGEAVEGRVQAESL